MGNNNQTIGPNDPGLSGCQGFHCFYSATTLVSPAVRGYSYSATARVSPAVGARGGGALLLGHDLHNPRLSGCQGIPLLHSTPL
jgi:hypothetical protein